MTTPGYDRGLALVDKLTAAGIPATIDPRSATPPCVLVTPPNKTYDVGCGFTAVWSLIVLMPGGGNADAWKAVDALETAVAGTLTVERSTFISYVLSPDNPALPAYRIEFSEGV
jgi:hypothetical protein